MRQHLLIDADDTLWENNIYFERAIHAFLEFLNHSSLSHDEVRAVLEEIELKQGYGTHSFVKSLQETFIRLAERTVSAADSSRFAPLVSRSAAIPWNCFQMSRRR